MLHRHCIGKQRDHSPAIFLIGVGMKIEAFSTEAVAHSSPVREWQDAMRRMVALDLKTKPRGLQPFQANVRVFSSNRLRFSALNVSSHVSTFDGGSRDNTKPYYLLAYLKDGSATVEQDGRETCGAAFRCRGLSEGP